MSTGNAYAIKRTPKTRSCMRKAFKTITAASAALSLSAVLAAPALATDYESVLDLATINNTVSVSTLLEGIESASNAAGVVEQECDLDVAVRQFQANQAAAEKKAQEKHQSKVSKLISVAKKQIGVPYVWGGSTPSGFDCSGLVMYVYSKLGISLSHNAQAQYSQTKSVSTDNLKKGDLVFFGDSTSSITHVGMYVGDGKFIHAPSTGEFVRIDSLADRTNFVGATRVL